MNQSEQVKELFIAISNMQSELKSALKDSKNPFFKSSYADLESCWKACRELLAANGLSVIQTTDSDGQFNYLITTLAHNSGQWIRGKFKLSPVKDDPQAMGSAMTYARRYALAAIVGLTQTDDDGEAAQGRSVGGGGIPMDHPTADDGNLDPIAYRIPFGKYVQRSLEEVGVDNLRNYVGYLESKAQKDGKQITGKILEFINLASDYVASFENHIG